MVRRQCGGLESAGRTEDKNEKLECFLEGYLAPSRALRLVRWRSVFIWLNGSGLETSGNSTHEEDCHGSSQVPGCSHHMLAWHQPLE